MILLVVQTSVSNNPYSLYKNGPDSAADLLLVYGDKSKMVQSWLFYARSDFFKTATHGDFKVEYHFLPLMLF